jgi:hypothetical protein
MNAEMRFTRNEINFLGEERAENMDNMEKMKELGIVSEKCNCSVYSMATVACGVLFAIGTVIYSLITM